MGVLVMDYNNQIQKVIKRINKNMKKINHPNLSGVAENGIYSANIKAFNDIEQWVFSFYTGMVFHAHNYTKDSKYLKYLNSFQEDYNDKIYKYNMDTIHDLGFLYSLYSVAMYKTTGDNKAKETALKAADELAKRFNIYGGYINAWERMDSTSGEKVGLMIADCMMNLPLLFWAYQETGHVFYKDVATAHADTTLKYMVRDDYSICHAYKFDRGNGTQIGERNFCGYSVGSAWARGTSWAIYGYAVAYRYTNNIEYLKTAKGLAEFFIANLKEDYIPLWDFRIDENTPKLLDTSAAAIAACGLLEISELDEVIKDKYKNIATKIVESLSLPKYCTLDEEDESMEAILKLVQTGDKQAGAMFGDYFYMEALMRLENCAEIFW